MLRSIAAATAIGLSLSACLLPSAWAGTAQLGIVKSRENEGHWLEITQRLQATGVDYCIVDWANIQKASDLGGTSLLFLPNIELLTPAQLMALQEWVSKGGRLIVSGPVGTLSGPEIRTRLRSLLGAYWGFGLTDASKLEPLTTTNQGWVQQSGLTAMIRGGVVIPASLNSSAVAVWREDEKPPAVVSTDQTIFFGWRWGIDQVASPEVDSAWLRAALSRYNVTPTLTPDEAVRSPQQCTPSPPPVVVSTPQISSPPTPLAQTDPGDVVAPASTQPSNTGSLTALQAAEMGQDLENLIGRFESALLTANALNSDVASPTGTANEQSLVASAKEAPNEAQTLSQPQRPISATRVLAEARAGLDNFRDAVAQADYNRARQQWFYTRRILWDNYPVDRKLAQPEIRAIWLDRGTIVSTKSEQDLAKIFDQLAAAGFNTVFFETVNASYPIYPSRVAPEQNPLVQGWDPLAAAVKLAHERGMELHAWVWIFAAANQRHNALLNQPLDYRGPVLTAHPDWGVFDRQGRLFDPNTKKAFLDPANPEVRRYLTALLEEIVSRYEVDGIQLDYIRYPFQDPNVNQIYGYGQAARQQFKELTGVDPIQVTPQDRDLWRQWTEFRIRQIDSFVATVSQRLHSKRPNLILSAAVFALPRPERLQRLQQNWEEWAIRGDIDLMVPMTYALDARSLHNLAQPVLTESTLSSTLILPAIRLLNLPDIVAVDQMQLLRDLPAGGYALFAVENLNSNLTGILGRTQGEISRSSSEPVPYRQPFPAAVARYTALQQEWNYLLANHQFLILEPALSEWRTQAEAVSIALNQLAAEPSAQNLSSAQAKLSSLRDRFPTWMQQQAVKYPYQVQVWSNRLATIERLLNYGERTMRSKP
ncbi:MAG TPA: family 10 glycosylhydrolase [Coleofasciculaceae cyanobacterium]